MTPTCRSIFVAALLCLIGIAACSSMAHAERAALVIGGDLKANERNLVSTPARQAIEIASWTVVEPKLAGKAVAELLSCINRGERGDAACTASLLDAAKADRAVVLQVTAERQGGENGRVVTGWVFRSNGESLAFLQRHCERCRSDLLRESTRELVTLLIREARSRARPSRLTVRSVPSNALINLNDRVVGTTDMDVSVYAGNHVVRLEKRGFHPATRQVSVDDGEHAEVEVELQPKDGPVATSGRQEGTTIRQTPQPTRSRLVPWLVVGAGGAALITGGVLFFMDEDESTPGNVRDWKYTNTAPLGLGVGAAGAAAIGIGAYLLLRGGEEPATAPVVAVGNGITGVGLRGTF